MIRKMRLADCDAIAVIEEQVFSTALDRGRLSALLNMTNFCGFVDDSNTSNTFNKIYRPGELVGYLLAMIIVDEAEILSIAVSLDHQKCGRGSELIQYFLTYIATQGIKAALLEVAADNVPALSLYTRLGFTEFGRRNAYYKRSDGCCDAIMMRRLCN